MRWRVRLVAGSAGASGSGAVSWAGAPPEGRCAQRTPRKGPKAEHKWLTASLIHPPEQAIADAFDQATASDPHHRRDYDWVILGARHQMDLIEQDAARRGVAVHILLDIVHVQYLWKAAFTFHTADDPAAEDWGAARALALLAGHASQVADAIEEQAEAAGLRGESRRGADACTGYLRAKSEFLGYDRALAAGWPIATGVIEGACRHLIADRLDISGARWGLAGAETVLKLRAVESNGDFDAYFRYHLALEHQRVHQDRCTLTA
ncbi:hypothetical protein AB0K74_48210 [Streptomyces sp. NPDC056159]|uniref:hypothetical protein n=1 Tax=unclassified Streptomyces TaxID=2593676 RepID=UPI00343639D6